MLARLAITRADRGTGSVVVERMRRVFDDAGAGGGGDAFAIDHRQPGIHAIHQVQVFQLPWGNDEGSLVGEQLTDIHVPAERRVVMAHRHQASWSGRAGRRYRRPR